MGKSNFSEQFGKLINRYKRNGYSLDIMLSAQLFLIIFNCTSAIRVWDSMTASS